MRLLILNQHYTPEIMACRFRIEASAGRLVARGHDDEVICSVPNHPSGVVLAGYRRLAATRREVDGVGVTYVWIRTSTSKGVRARFAAYSSYAGMALSVVMVTRAPDVIATAPPIGVAVAGRIPAWRNRVPGRRGRAFAAEHRRLRGAERAVDTLEEVDDGDR